MDFDLPSEHVPHTLESNGDGIMDLDINILDTKTTLTDSSDYDVLSMDMEYDQCALVIGVDWC